MRGYDVRTGKLLWTFHTIPAAGEPGTRRGSNGSAECTGNAGVWARDDGGSGARAMSICPSKRRSPISTAASVRATISTATASCASTRRRARGVWHYQLIHHDIWDWDNPTAPILMDLVVDGRPIKAVAQITKQAFVYTFDRVTGEPVWPIEERPVPQTDVPGEWTSPTQPFPTKPPAVRSPRRLRRDDLIDFTPALRAEAVEGDEGVSPRADLHAAVARECGRRHAAAR